MHRHRAKSRLPHRTALLTALVAPWLAADTARACSILAIHQNLTVIPQVPSDGVVLGQFVSCEACDVAELVVVDEAGDEVAGSAELLAGELGEAGFFAFRPEAPLRTGRMYSLQLPDAVPLAYSDMTSFLAIASDGAAPVVTARIAATEAPNNPEPCEEYDDDALIGSCAYPMFARDYTRRAQVVLLLQKPAATQLTYRTVWKADDELVEDRQEPPALTFKQRFEGTPLTVCYEVLGTPVAGGSERVVGSGCLDTSALWLGVRAAPLYDFEEIARACIAWPAGFRDAYCEAYPKQGCAIPEGTLGRPENAGDASSDGDADAGPDAGPKQRSEHDSGHCTSAAGRPGGSAWAWLCAALLGYAARRRGSPARS